MRFVWINRGPAMRTGKNAQLSQISNTIVVSKIRRGGASDCRREFEQRVTDRHMAEDYIRIYQQLLRRSSTHAAAWSINNCSGVTTVDLPHSVLRAPCSLLGPASGDPVLFFKPYRLRSGSGT